MFDHRPYYSAGSIPSVDPPDKQEQKQKRVTKDDVRITPYNVVINTDGNKGMDGRSGLSSAYGWESKNGSDASSAQNGYDARDINISLKADNNLVIEETNSDTTLIVTNLCSTILLSAKGGIGGSGAEGGDGRYGDSGSVGKNATCETRGTNGGRGGTGGDAGRCADGGDGGKGGNIKINVQPNDLDLLMLIEHNISGGVGGTRAEAKGGEGGDGGTGGRSYHDTIWKTVYDSEGSPSSTTEEINIAGGENGPRGNPGKSTSSKAGNNGLAGSFLIDVNGAIYKAPYNIQITRFEVYDTNRTGIIEPGTEIIITNIGITNIGEMPLLTSVPTRIFLEDTQFGITNKQELLVPRGLMPKEEYDFGKLQLKIKIKDVNIFRRLKRESNKKFVHYQQKDTIEVGAIVSRVERKFKKTAKKEIVIQFPAIISDINYVEYSAIGKPTRFKWTISNQSLRALGMGSENKRKLTTSISFESGTLKDGDFIFIDKNGKKTNLSEKISYNLDQLKEGSSLEIEGKILFLSHVKAGNSVKATINLYLDKLNSQEHRLIQSEEVTLNCGISYRKTEGSKYLIVTSTSLDPRVIDSWKKVISKENAQFDIWDITLHGHLDLSKQLNSKSTLLEDFKDSTLIIVGNPFSLNGVASSPYDFLSADNLITAITNFNIRFLFILEESYENSQEKRLSRLVTSVEEEANTMFFFRDSTNTEEKSLYQSLLLATSFVDRIKMLDSHLKFPERYPQTDTEILLKTLLYDITKEYLELKDLSKKVLKIKFNSVTLDAFLSYVSKVGPSLETNQKIILLDFLVELGSVVKSLRNSWQIVLFWTKTNFIISTILGKIENTAFSFLGSSKNGLIYFNKKVSQKCLTMGNSESALKYGLSALEAPYFYSRIFSPFSRIFSKRRNQ